jgi:tRNA(Ile)-lysidine synthetase-like protein
MMITIYSTGKAGTEKGTALSWPVCMRSRRPGDSLALPSGHKMVDSLLSECRIPAVLRDTLPVVEDRMGIVALLSSCAGGRDYYRDTDNSSESGTVHDVSIEFFAFDVKGAVLTDAT